MWFWFCDCSNPGSGQTRRVNRPGRNRKIYYPILQISRNGWPIFWETDYYQSWYMGKLIVTLEYSLMYLSNFPQNFQISFMFYRKWTLQWYTSEITFKIVRTSENDHTLRPHVVIFTTVLLRCVLHPCYSLISTIIWSYNQAPPNFGQVS